MAIPASGASLNSMRLPGATAQPLRTWRPLTPLLWLLTTGCANPGPPRPPSLHLPRPVTDLSAERVDGEVRLHWTNPSKSTDGLPVQPTMIAELCRSAARVREICRPVQQIAVAPGKPGEWIDRLPPALAEGPPALLIYRIRLRNGSGHDAGPSAPAFAAAGSAPPPVTGLQARPWPEGALVEWTRVPGAAPVLLDRTAVAAPGAGAAAAPPPPPRTANPTFLGAGSGAGSGAASGAGSAVQLRAADAAGTDPGGTEDRTAGQGLRYRYTAARVREADLEGHRVTLRSHSSAPVFVSVRDIFPPQPPSGLASVPGAPGARAAEISLSWEPSPEPDLLGYNVYRTAAGAGPPPPPGAWVRLNREPLAAPAFRDEHVTAGTRYLYRVTAVDRSGNESQPGPSLGETAAAPSGTEP